MRPVTGSSPKGVPRAPEESAAYPSRPRDSERRRRKESTGILTMPGRIGNTKCQVPTKEPVPEGAHNNLGELRRVFERVVHGLRRVDRQPGRQHAHGQEPADGLDAPRGAQLRLQVRTCVLNHERREIFSGWYPGMEPVRQPALKEAA